MARKRSEWAERQLAVSDALDKRLKNVKINNSVIKKVDQEAREQRIAAGYALLAQDAENRAINYRERYGYHAGEVGRASRDAMSRLSDTARRRLEEAEKNQEGFEKYYSAIAGFYGGDIASAADKAYKNAIEGYSDVYDKAGSAVEAFSNRPLTKDLGVGFTAAKSINGNLRPADTYGVSAANKALTAAKQKVADAVKAEDLIAWNKADDERIAAEKNLEVAKRNYIAGIVQSAGIDYTTVKAKRASYQRQLNLAMQMGDEDMAEQLQSILVGLDARLEQLQRSDYLTPAQREGIIAGIEADRLRDKNNKVLGANARANSAVSQLEDAQWFYDVGAELEANLTTDEWRMVMERPVREVGKAYNGFDVRGRYISDDAWNLLVDRFGKEKANQYYQYIKQLHDAEDMQKQAEILAGLTDNLGGEITGSALSIPGNLLGGTVGVVDLAAQGVRKAITGTPVNWNSPAQQAAAWAPEVRSNVSSHIQYGRDGTQSGTGRDVAAFLYNTGMSMADSALAMAVGQNYGGLLLAGGAGTVAARDAKERGASDWQALGYGVAAGAAEAIFEKISIDKFLSIQATDDVFDAVFSMLNQSLTEASEETLTSLSNTVADQLINGGASQISTDMRAFIAQGYTEDEARQLAVQKWAASLGQDALAGFVSGSAFGTFCKIAQTVKNRQTQKAQKNTTVNVPVSMYALERTTAPANAPNTPVAAFDSTAEEMGVQAAKTRPASFGSAIAATDSKTGRGVAVEGIAEVDKGKVTLRLQDGSTVDAADLSFADRNTQQLMSTARTFDTKTARAFVSGYDGSVDARTYAEGFMTAYGAARRNVSLNEAIRQSAALRSMPSSAQHLAYMAGQNTMRKPSAVEVPAVNNAEYQRQVSAFSKAGKVDVSEVSRDTMRHLSKDQKAGIALGRSLNAVFGVNVRMVESKANAEGRFVSENGSYNRTTNTITIDLNAGRMNESDRRTMIMLTFGHELTHYVEARGGERYRELRQFVVDRLTEQGELENSIKRSQDSYKAATQKEMSREAAISEVVAEACADILADADIMQTMQQQNPGLFNTIRNFVQELLNKINKLINQYGANTVEGQMLKPYRDEMTRLWEAAFAEAAETEGSDVATTNSNVSYSVEQQQQRQKIDASMTDSERASILKQKKIVAGVYKGQADEAIKKTENDLYSEKIGLIKDALVKIGNEFGVFVDYNISDVGVRFLFSRSNIRESVSKEIDPARIAKLLPIFRTAVEGAVGVEIHANRYFFDDNTVFFENLLGGYFDGNDFIPIRFGLKHSVSGESTLYVIVDQNPIEAKKIKAEVVKTPDAHTTRTKISRSAVGVSIADVIPFVNAKDFLRYIPDDMLSAEQKKIKWEAIAETIKKTNDKNDRKYAEFISKGDIKSAQRMVSQAAEYFGYTTKAYHGTPNGTFNIFKNWQYFTENKEYADRYQNQGASSISYKKNADAPRTYSVFLKIEKPFDTRRPKERKIFMDEFYRQWGNGSPLSEKGLPDWVDGYDFPEFFEENDLDYDSVYLDEGADGGYGDKVQSRGVSIVVRDSVQIKSADPITYDDEGNVIPLSQRFNEEQEDIRYQLRRSVTYKTEDVVTRNTNLGKLTTREQQKLEEYVDAANRLNDIKRVVNGIRNTLSRESRVEEMSAERMYELVDMMDDYMLEADKLTHTVTRLENGVLKRVVRGNVRQAVSDTKAEARAAKNTAMRELRKSMTAKKNEAVKEARKEERAKAQDRVDAVREKERERANERVAAAKRNEREKIEADQEIKTTIKRADTLKRWMTANSGKRHIPDRLKAPVVALTDEILQIAGTAKAAQGALPARRIGNILRDLHGVLSRQQSAQYNDSAESQEADLGVFLDLDPHMLDDMEKFYGSIQKRLDARENSGKKMLGVTLTADELHMLSDTLSRLNRAITKANALHHAEYFASVDEIARETDSVMKVRGRRQYENALTDAALFDMATPVTFFDRFGNAGKSIFKGLVKGTGKRSMLLDQVEKFTSDLYTAKEARAWGKADRTITIGGQQLKISGVQAMELYCLAHRDNAVTHMTGKGVIFRDQKRNTNPEPIQLRAENIAEIRQNKIGGETLLTDKQLEVANALRKYMKTLSEWGNEVSMKRWEVAQFIEPNYWPMQTDDSSRNLRDPEQSKGDFLRLLNASFTKALTPNANNALYIGNALTTFAAHATDMAAYNALALPLLDAMRWINYRATVNGREINVRRSIEGAYGKASINYFMRLMKDLNNVHDTANDAASRLAKKLTSAYKVAAVGANLRVALLQFTSYYRAGYTVAGRDLFKGAAIGLTHMKRNVQEAQRYSGIAKTKAAGYYDVGLNRGMEERIAHTDSAFIAGYETVKGWSMKPAEWGDRWTWGMLWEACKQEVKRQSPKLTGEAFMETVADKFDDAVYRTQVVDSILTKSQLMRSSNALTGMITSFMSEPTQSYNMIMGASERIREAKRSGNEAELKEAKVQFTRATAAYFASVAAAVVVGAIMKAERDDDEYEKWWEKIMQGLAEEAFDQLNPLNNIPITRDIVSLIRGYNVDRMDMVGIANCINAIRIMEEFIKLKNGTQERPTELTYYGNMSVYGAISKVLQAVSQIAGLPLYNFVREGVSAINATMRILGQPQVEQLKAYNGKDNAVYDKMFSRAVDGNDEGFSELAYAVIAEGGKEDDVISEMKKRARDMYRAGDMTDEEAEEFLVEYCGADRYATGANSIAATLERWMFTPENEDDTFSIYNPLREMLEDDSTTKKQYETEFDRLEDTYGTKTSSIKSTITTELKDDYAKGSSLERAAILQVLLNTGLYGKNLREVKENTENWVLDWYWNAYEAQWINEPESRKDIEKMIIDAGVKAADLAAQIKKTKDDMKD